MNNKYDYKINATVVEGRFTPVYEAVIRGDDAGWVRKSVLYARGDMWTSQFQNQPIVTIVDRDCELELTIHKPGKEPVKFDLNISDLADVRALVEVMNRTYKGKYFTPLKISKVKETRRIK